MASAINGSANKTDGLDADANVTPEVAQVKTVSATKNPPPENERSIWTRTKIILSFWVVIFCVGIPMWWQTTSVYRARLPFQEMLDWDHGTVSDDISFHKCTPCSLTVKRQACLPSFPLEIKVAAPSVACPEAKHFVRTTQHALDDLNEFAPHHLRLRLVQASDASVGQGAQGCHLEEVDAHDGAATLVVKLESRDGQPPELRVHSFSEEAILYYSANQLPSQSSSTSQVATYLATELHSYFKDEQASIAYKFATQNAARSPGATGLSTRTNGNPSSFVRGLPKELYDRISGRDTRAFKYSDTYHITFSLFTEGAKPSSWDIAEALNTYIDPWVDALSSISHFTVNSQIQLYSQFSPSIHPIQDTITNGTKLAKADLSAFVNAAEWPLSPSIGSSGPTINFVLYVPSVSQSPLTIADTNGGTDWLIPQWGGIAIYNPIISSTNGSLIVPDRLDSTAMANAFTIFRSQLLSLLGLPGETNTPLPLRLQSLLRIQITSLFLSASSTLGSLARLTQSLPSIPIPLSVARSVDSTISHLTQTCKALDRSQFEVALSNARQAETEAEQAFFEKSMVGQVYFPDEHKFAVYMPLLGPISFPLVLGLIKEVKFYVQRWKKRSQR